MLNISPVTLWRWRQAGAFPVAKRINGRLYFPLHKVGEWIDKQQDAVARHAPANLGGFR
jgi:predicted site-specific integrase-resolvase